MTHFYINGGEIINKFLLDSKKKISKYSTKTDTTQIWLNNESSIMVW